MVLLGAVDAALVTDQVTLTGWTWGAWIFACGLVFIVVCGYESRLQIRNDGDRDAMVQLYNRLCDLVGGIETDSPVRELFTRRESRGLWLKFGWAFPWQMILLFSVAAVSAFVPFLKNP